MLVPILSGALVGALMALVFIRREQRIRAEAASLAEQIRELSVRLTTVEQSSEQAAIQAEVTANVLLDKGVADEEDLAAARRRFGEVSDSPVQGEPARVRPGSVH
jgi:hypothetical protein